MEELFFYEAAFNSSYVLDLEKVIVSHNIYGNGNISLTMIPNLLRNWKITPQPILQVVDCWN